MLSDILKSIDRATNNYLDFVDFKDAFFPRQPPINLNALRNNITSEQTLRMTKQVLSGLPAKTTVAEIEEGINKKYPELFGYSDLPQPGTVIEKDLFEVSSGEEEEEIMVEITEGIEKKVEEKVQEKEQEIEKKEQEMREKQARKKKIDLIHSFVPKGNTKPIRMKFIDGTGQEYYSLASGQGDLGKVFVVSNTFLKDSTESLSSPTLSKLFGKNDYADFVTNKGQIRLDRVPRSTDQAVEYIEATLDSPKYISIIEMQKKLLDL